jgi:hypothetical protein
LDVALSQIFRMVADESTATYGLQAFSKLL